MPSTVVEEIEITKRDWDALPKGEKRVHKDGTCAIRVRKPLKKKSGKADDTHIGWVKVYWLR